MYSDAEMPSARRRRPALWVVAVGVIALLAVVAGVLFAAGVFEETEDDGGLPSAAPLELNVGDCFDFFDFAAAPESFPERKISCKQAHDGEAYAVIRVGETDVFPGAEVLERTAREQCPARADAYTDGAWRSAPALTVKYTYPNAISWEVDGIRAVTCMLRAESGEKLTGSVRRG
ncbi:septum formation family protein [Yinghuangia sp. YIM S09857]|uniref:septum formation family protein n=1 Tax=Yinghuangia sp. YIM S09857 TaxID=3436929 RepID=UPI003F531BC9